MEKLFWGMVAGCTIAFSLLLGMYLNKTGVIDFSKTDDAQEITTEADTTEGPEDISSLVNETQKNYGLASAALEDLPDNHKTTPESSPVKTEQINPSSLVDADRNDDHDYFMGEEEEEASEEASSTEESDTPESKKNKDYQYTLYKDHVVINKYLGNRADLVIPDTIDDQPVTELAASSFSSAKTLVNVDIPDTVVTIGDNAFKGSKSLVAVEMPDALTSLGIGAFDGCAKLARMEIPDGVTTIGNKTFNGCNALTYVSMPSEITSIGEQAFNNCFALEKLTLPEDLQTIGKNRGKCL